MTEILEQNAYHHDDLKRVTEMNTVAPVLVLNSSLTSRFSADEAISNLTLSPQASIRSTASRRKPIPKISQDFIPPRSSSLSPPSSPETTSSSFQSTSTTAPELTYSRSTYSFNTDTDATTLYEDAYEHHAIQALEKKTSASPLSFDWTLEQELDIRLRLDRLALKRPSPADKALLKQRRKNFSPSRPPTEIELYEASLSNVVDENGFEIPFGTLWFQQRTVVCFIRHFWCPICQDYTISLMDAKPDELLRAGLKVIVIGQGHHSMISAYKKYVGNDSIPVHTDVSRRIYHALGMTKRTMNAGPESERGDYTTKSTAENIAYGVKSVFHMPLKSPGDQKQLGGEFVFGPGLHCAFTHRMTTTRNHADFTDILQAIGTPIPRLVYAKALRKAASCPLKKQSLKVMVKIEESDEQ